MVRLLQLELRGLPIEALRSRLWWPDGAGAAAAGCGGSGGSSCVKYAGHEVGCAVFGMVAEGVMDRLVPAEARGKHVVPQELGVAPMGAVPIRAPGGGVGAPLTCMRARERSSAVHAAEAAAEAAAISDWETHARRVGSRASADAPMGWAGTGWRGGVKERRERGVIRGVN